jgi:hypothetical protein
MIADSDAKELFCSRSHDQARREDHIATRHQGSAHMRGIKGWRLQKPRELYEVTYILPGAFSITKWDPTRVVFVAPVTRAIWHIYADFFLRGKLDLHLDCLIQQPCPQLAD